MRAVRIAVPCQQQSQCDEWRILVIAAVANLFVVEADIILGDRVPQSVVMRMIGLNEYSAGAIATSGAAGNLSNQLKSSFCGTKIRQRQPGVDRDYAHERDVREIVTLREHLRADQQIQLAFFKVKQGLFEFAPAGLRVAIDAADPQIRKALVQQFFDLFRAFADVIDVLARANRALRWRALVMIAVMTNQSLIAAMICERHFAVRAHDRFAT